MELTGFEPVTSSLRKMCSHPGSWLLSQTHKEELAAAQWIGDEAEEHQAAGCKVNAAETAQVAATHNRIAMSNNAVTVGGGAIYGLGIFGALVYYLQQANVFWEYLLSFVQGFFWPAWMVYEIFATLGG